ncbi:MAG: hypothetical protein H7124_06175 [Phycisphaerales bacterium]|nr:hypothetical protein [Hyphomonadaceae bacterium]
MNQMFSRLREACVTVAAAGAAAALLAAQPAAATEMTPAATQQVDITVTANARIVSVHRSRAATGYERRSERVSDDGYDWAPIAYRDVVRVTVEIADPKGSRADADERPQQVTLELDPGQLNAEQNAALSSRRMSQRIAPFQLHFTTTSSIVRRVNRAQSYLCSGDQFRCEDRLVFEDAPVERVQLSVL